MHSPTTFLLAIALILPFTHSQTPSNFTPSTANPLEFQFGSTLLTRPGIQININVPASKPVLALPALPSSGTSSTFLFALVDPDAHTPQNPDVAQYLHWLQPNITLSRQNQSFVLLNTAATPIVPFTQPAPPSNSSAHRYIGLLFVQPADFAVPADFKGFSAENRTLFNVTNFAREAGLGSPVAGSYFLVSNETTTTTATATATATAGSSSASTTTEPIATGAAVRVLVEVSALWAVVGLGALFAL